MFSEELLSPNFQFEVIKYESINFSDKICIYIHLFFFSEKEKNFCQNIPEFWSSYATAAMTKKFILNTYIKSKKKN